MANIKDKDPNIIVVDNKVVDFNLSTTMGQHVLIVGDVVTWLVFAHQVASRREKRKRGGSKGSSIARKSTIIIPTHNAHHP